MTPPAGSESGIWSDGNLLVVHKQAMLPSFCVKTNAPANKQIERKFYWHSKWVYLAILINLLAYIPMVYCAIVLQIKRWHDRGKSGWWCLINLIPYIGRIWAFVEAGCLRGKIGPNKFGPDPLQGR